MPIFTVGKMLKQGEVVFESGSNTILKGGAVKLDKGTRIEKGARVSIN